MNPRTPWVNLRLTEQQQAAAYADFSIAVTAGAGTGKTHMLAERYLHHLMTGHSPLQIVAMTFTEKAAAELRSRVRKTLRDRLDNPDWRAELEAAQITTFHSLATRICREHPDAADVPPDFVVLDELEGSVWQADVMEEAIAHIPSSFFEKVPYSLMHNAIWSFLSDPLSAEKALRYGKEDWLQTLNDYRTKILEAIANNTSWQEAYETLQSLLGPSPEDKREQARVTALELATQFAETKSIQCLEGLTTISLSGGSRRQWGEEAFNAVKDAINQLKAIAKSNFVLMQKLEVNEWDEATARVLPVLREAFEQVRSHLQAAKQQQRVLDYNDLEIHALKALESSDVREYYAQRWQVFLIDEFQDTNPTQGELLDRLTQNKLLTIVGDEKQSIYGFRRADVQMFRAWQQRLLTVQSSLNAEHYPIKSLNRSFRAHKTLLDSVNAIFHPVLGNSYEALVAVREPEPHAAPHLEFCPVQVPSDWKPSADERRRVEGQHIADRIETWVAANIEIHDKATGQLRPIIYGDIAILSPTWSSLELYGEVLESRGIPVLQAGGGNLLDTREAKDTYALLRFLANPGDDLALVAVLRSPFFAVSDRTLAQLANSRENETWWQHLISSATPDLSYPVETLQVLLQKRRLDSPSRLLRWADRLTGYTAAIANLPNARRREADWRGFLDFVQQREQGHFDSVSIVRTLQRLTAAEVTVSRPVLEAGNAVNLLTIHAAKGLEWPVVIVSDLTRRPNNDGAPVRFDPAIGVAVKLNDDAGEVQKSALYALLEHQQKQLEHDESKRLLYVALTRARDRLLLTAPEEKGSRLDLLLPGLNQVLDPTPIPFQSLEAIDFPLPQPPDSLNPLRNVAKPCGSGLHELPVTALTDYALCPKRFRYRHYDGHLGDYEGSSSSAYGAEIGTLTHQALEYSIETVEQLELFNLELPTEVVEEALQLAQNFRQSTTYEPFRDSASKFEQPITLEYNSLTFNGVIDLLAPDFVLDFKTDKEMNPHHHRLQLWAYSEATQKATAHIAYLRHNQVYSFDEVGLEAIAQEAETVIQNIEQGNFQPTPSATVCQICPCNSFCEDRISL
ncbi:UvrD-helicase domain-containing protein [Vacuolonema iberomarrocanum]|uniref:UvrD-helicase domain-containing protein n=1 Tax=Vacuolonema iberomarrocanum TaxID=3454632 RepID=UPI0019E1850B|nr:UvrD-helicase domain-containing protein [filamentous cyanobacterium LEGE 07170]